jgi:hypothetical protein
MTFYPGQSGNPAGRKQGSRNKRTEELFFRLEDRGDLDPAELLSSIITNQNEPKELRIQAAGLLLPYKYSKPQASPPKIYVDEQIKLPHISPKTISQSNENILYLSELKATGQIDLHMGDNLIMDQCRVRDGLIDDAKLLAANGGSGDQHIVITGGLPQLPGCENLIMPQINGHVIDSVAIESRPQAQKPGSTDHNTRSEDPGP